MEQGKIGDPWSVLPIKNALYAKECTEVDLSGRNLEGLQNFEYFPNLEVVFLNKNQLTNLNALTPNFRLKRICCTENQLVDIDVVRNFKFLEILLLSHNQLKDLDHLLGVLSKLSFLEQLALDGNPVAEEPRYRLRIISQMPKLKVLDRHVVSVQERIKAEKILSGKTGGKKVQGTEPKKKIKVSEALSQGEKNLYKEVEKIKHKQLEEKKKNEEEKKRATMPKEYTGMPEPPLITHLRKKSAASYANKLTDFEIDEVEALLHKTDSKGKGVITVEEFKGMLEKLYDDECNMGKVPVRLNESQLNLFIQRIKGPSEEQSSNSDLPVKDIMKCMNEIDWKLLDDHELQARIEKFYAEAKKLMMMGKKEEALKLATKASHLSGAKERSKPIEIQEKKKAEEKSRKDVLNIKLPVKKSDTPSQVTVVVNNMTVTAKTKYEFAKVTKSLGQPRHIPIS